MPIQRFERNTAGRDLIVGDIHGCFTKLQAALDAIKFDPARDRLFSVGDLVDRGPESDQVTDWLAKPWFHAIMGNHEEAAIVFAEGKLDNYTYLRGFSGAWNIANPQAERQRLADAFSALPLGFELVTAQGLVGVLHADCPTRDWEELKRRLAAGGNESAVAADCCTWSRARCESLDDSIIAGVRAVVVGHTPFKQWTSLGNVIYIDTYAWRGGNYTILDAETLRPAERLPDRALDWSGCE